MCSGSTISKKKFQNFNLKILDHGKWFHDHPYD